MKSNYQKKAIENVFDERSNFIVIGLTGRTGSGCTTTANFFKKSYRQLAVECLYPQQGATKSDPIRDERIINRYAQLNWAEFDVIKARDVILTFILKDWDAFYESYCKAHFKKGKSEKEKFEKELTKYTKQELSKKHLPPIANENGCDKDRRNIKKNLLKEGSKGSFEKKFSHESNIVPLMKRMNNHFLALWDHPHTPGKNYSKESNLYERSYIYIQKYLPAFGEALHRILKNKGIYTNVFQKCGNSIRMYGTIKQKNQYKQNEPIHFFDIAKRMNMFIKALRHPHGRNASIQVKVVIDSLKNFYESVYLRSRYTAFYLISVTKNEEIRRKHFTKTNEREDITKIDFNERPNEARKTFKLFCELCDSNNNIFNKKITSITSFENSFNALKKRSKNFTYQDEYRRQGLTLEQFSCCKAALQDKVRIYAYVNQLHQFLLQDVEACIQDSDIFLTNNETNSDKEELKKSILRYTSLIQHPGLIPPTPIERCMQMAYTAKANSGCISRQVGAVVTNKNYDILSIGWNDVPCGEISCIRRNLIDIFRHHDLPAYSDFEIQSDSLFQQFLKHYDFSNLEEIKELLHGLPFAYCFKDIYCELTGDKNQVHTRALHGEEKALMSCDQKEAVNGFLFTTSSPCELCAKKAKQYRIKTIYYIEPYPGISQSHICNAGDLDNRAQYELFHGAIGRAYYQLYTPVMAYKDELELRGVNELKKEAPVNSDQKNK